MPFLARCAYSLMDGAKAKTARSACVGRAHRVMVKFGCARKVLGNSFIVKCLSHLVKNSLRANVPGVNQLLYTGCLSTCWQKQLPSPQPLSRTGLQPWERGFKPGCGCLSKPPPSPSRAAAVGRGGIEGGEGEGVMPTYTRCLSSYPKCVFCSSRPPSRPGPQARLREG